MSNALAIAAVTRTLLDLLNNGLIDNDVGTVLANPVVVTAKPPDRVLGQQAQGQNDPTQLNVYLYQITFNQGWRQHELPARDVRGDRTSVPLLALNLHYLVTAYGATDLASEMLLGYAMQILHENPVLSRTALRKALVTQPVGTDILPEPFDQARALDLADQVELVKITPEGLSLDEISKVWTALQTHYRMSASYMASVVLIESRVPRRTPLPVLTRGQRDAAGREPGVFVNPDLLPAVPTLDTILPDNKQIVVRLGEKVTLQGHRLDAAQVFARFFDRRTQQALELQTTGVQSERVAQLPAGAGAGGVDPDDASDTDNWRAGIYDVSLRLRIAADKEVFTNTLSVVLAPRILSIAAASAADETTFTVKCTPRVHRGQTVALLVGSRALEVETLTTPMTDTLEFKGRDFEIGTSQWVRLRVDGVDSVLVDRSVTPPRFFPSEQVVIA